MDIDVLGTLRLDAGSATLAPRERMVLTALAVQVGSILTIDELADVLWGDAPPVSAPKVVQGCIARLRKALGPHAVETTPAGYRLTGEGVELDSATFVSLLAESHEHRATGDAAGAVESLTAALGLWRGRPFADVTDWAPAEAEAARLNELRLVAEEDLLELRMDLGDHAGVAADALTLAAAEPWRERRWVVLALAQYRCGRQTDALATIRRAGQALRTELGVDPGPELTSLEESVLKQDPSLLVPAALSGPYDDSCPYMGLAAYGVDDEALFFGRTRLVAELAARLDDSPLLVVAGDSGAGKSSVIRAGLIPLLSERGREAVILLPTHDPQTAVAAAMGAAAEDDPVVVIDQFEEIFTQGADVAAWLSWVVEYATTRAPLVLAIRADHMGGLAQNPDLARLVEKGMHLVRPLAGDELREAIEGPARAAGLALDAGLVDLIVRDVEGEPGGQPLMSHALMETWHRRVGRTMTVEGYRASGGIRGAVTRSAERLYRGLDEQDRDAVRSIMMRLCPVDDDGRPERARVALSVFIDDRRSMRMIETLVRARLVTATEGQVEVAHEALARTWPRLRKWLGDDAAGRRIFKHLVDAAQGWDSLGRPESELYRGGRLEIAMDWRSASRDRLSAVETAFLDASAEQAQRVRADLTRRNRRLRTLLSGVAGLLVVALVAGFFAVANGRTAADERDAAEQAEQASRHETMVSQSAALRSTDRGLAALLAAEAYRGRPDPRAYSALLGTFTGSPGFMGYTRLDGTLGVNGALVPGTSNAVVAVDGRDLRRVDLDTGEVEDVFDQPDLTGAGDLSVVRVSADGRYVAQVADISSDSDPMCFSPEIFEHGSGSSCSSLSVYALDGKRVLGPINPPFQAGDIALSHDGSYLAVAGGYQGDVALYRVSDGALVGTVPGHRRPDGLPNGRDTGAVAFAGDTLWAGDLTGPIRRLAVPSLDVVDELKAPAGSAHNFLTPLSDGTIVASGDRWIVSLDSRSGELNWKSDIADETWPCPYLAVAEKAGSVFCGTYWGRIEERELETGRLTERSFDPQQGQVGDLAVGDDGDELIAFGDQAAVLARWRLDGAGPTSELQAPGKVALQGVGAAGTFPVARMSGGREPETVAPVQMWDADDNRAARTIKGARNAWRLGSSALALEDGEGIYAVEGADDPAAAAKAITTSAWFGPSTDGSQVIAVHHPDAIPGPITIDFYDLPSFRKVRTVSKMISGDFDGLMSAATSPDGSRLYAAMAIDFEARLYVYDVTDGREISHLTTEVNLVAVSPNGEIVTATATGQLAKRSPGNLDHVENLPGAPGEFQSVQFGPEGRLMAAVAWDNTIHLYDLKTRSRLGDPIGSSAYRGPAGTGWLSSDGKRLAVNEERGVVMWDLDARHMLAAACRVAGRNLTKAEWTSYVGADIPYRKTCEPFLAG